MKKLCLLLVVLISCGCAHTPPEKAKLAAPAAKPELSAALVNEAIVKGKTSRDELVAKLGPPNSVERNPNPLPKLTDPEKIQKVEKLKQEMKIPPQIFAVETWNYWKISGGIRTFLVEFYLDTDGVVQDYKITDKAVGP
jgi:hypothetical protein